MYGTKMVKTYWKPITQSWCLDRYFRATYFYQIKMISMEVLVSVLQEKL